MFLELIKGRGDIRVLIRKFCAGMLVSAIWVTACTASSTLTYQYDTLGRLKVVQYPSGKSVTYSYDAAGNRTQVVSVGLAGPHAVDDTYVTDPNLLTNDGTPTPAFDPKQNDTDANQYALTIILPFGATAHGGTATLGSDNKVTYTPPNNGYSGTDSFTYTISDGHGGSDQGTITVTMNSPPTANPDTRKNTGVQTAYTGFLANDTDPDGDTLSIIAPGSTPVGTQYGGSVTASGAYITYTPPATPPNWHGADTFTYTISDGLTGNPHTSTTTVTVNVNHPPVAVDDYATALSPGGGLPPTVTFDPSANDTDVDIDGSGNSDSLVVKSVDPPAPQHGTAVRNGNHSVTYTVTDTNYHGPDSFKYTVKDTAGNTASATVNITVP